MNKLRAAHEPAASAVGAQAFEHTQRNLQAAAQACDPGLLDQLAQRICRARRVLFMGFGSSHHVAALAPTRCSLICPRCWKWRAQAARSKPSGA
ncbi:hypothetical protein ACHFCA_15995 [Delftia tsuruhatensis]